MYLNGKPYTYSIIEKNIVISAKDEPFSISETAAKRTGMLFKGKVIDNKNNPLFNANIAIEGTSKVLTTDSTGECEVNGVDSNTILHISYVSCVSQRVRAADFAAKVIKLNVQDNELVTVTINTGYQSLSKEKATGSFVFVNNELLNRRVSTNILDRLPGIGSGILFSSNGVNSKESLLSIRGRNTIFSNTYPLIVVDNFPYTGDLNNINPNDIESITILKDAGAAAIWGAFSGNGVVVITTKRGKPNQAIKVDLYSNITLGQKPDLNYNPQFIQSTDMIAIESELFNKHFYDRILNQTPYPGTITPVIGILYKRRAGLISASDSASQIDALRKNDVRNDLYKYFFQPAFNQQHAINISGGSKSNAYQFSAGYDRDIPVLTKNQFHRITLATNNTFILSPKLELQAGLNYTETKFTNNNGGIDTVSLGDRDLYPYAQLANENGISLAIPRRLPLYVADTIHSMLDWHYRPLDEIRNANNTTRLFNTSVNSKVLYKIIPALRLEGTFQYMRQTAIGRNLQGLGLFNTRDLINLMYNPNGASDKDKNPVPVGGILDETNISLKSIRARGQINFERTFHGKHVVSAIAGAEKSNVDIEYSSNRSYGYNENTSSSVASINNADRFPTFRNMEGSLTIPSGSQFRTTSDVGVSYFINASYTYDRKYTFSASGRKDGINILGAKFNNRFTPLWFTEASWIISNENFLQSSSWISYLKLSTNIGYMGDVNTNIPAVQTLTMSATSNTQGLSWSSINNPENPDLGWERIRHINIGLHFGILNQRITGHIEAYFKQCNRVIGLSKLAPSAGYAGLGMQGYMTNSAKTKNHGIDLDITSINIKGNFTWTTFITYSLFKDKIVTYEQEFTSLAVAQSSGGYNDIHTPVVGKPLSAIFSYKWAGLDPNNGDPRGFIGKEPSNDYDALLNMPLNSMQYNGPAQPVSFGSMINTFSWKHFILSASILYKLGYFFRASTINYFALYTTDHMHKDYYNRWQHPGDVTNVPSMVFPLNSTSRDDFYANAAINVQRADQIRFQDVRLSYDFSNIAFKSIFISNIQLYLFADNLGLLWKANQVGLDPDYPTSYRPARTLTFGCKVNF